MTKQIESYLSTLREMLASNDSAIVQDALADAEEHLRTALAEQQAEQPESTVEDLLPTIIEQYGSPEEIAQAYQTVEEFTQPALTKKPTSDDSFIESFFKIYGDPRAWSALLYMLISLVTGTLFFTWAVTGLSVSLSFALFIFGLPVAAFFLYSVRGVAIIEGRLIEALLGVRMPRRAVFWHKGEDWKENLKRLFMDKSIWLMIFYMVLMLPLGVFYFTLFVVLLSVSLSFTFVPIVAIFIDLPVFINGDLVRYLTTAEGALMSIGGFLLLTITLHLAKGLGFLQGKLAKAILVAE